MEPTLAVVSDTSQRTGPPGLAHPQCYFPRSTGVHMEGPGSWGPRPNFWKQQVKSHLPSQPQATPLLVLGPPALLLH